MSTNLVPIIGRRFVRTKGSRSSWMVGVHGLVLGIDAGRRDNLPHPFIADLTIEDADSLVRIFLQVVASNSRSSVRAVFVGSVYGHPKRSGMSLDGRTRADYRPRLIVRYFVQHEHVFRRRDVLPAVDRCWLIASLLLPHAARNAKKQELSSPQGAYDAIIMGTTDS